MNHCKFLPIVLFSCLMANAQSYTPAQAEKVVKGAVAFAKQNGMEKLILETNLPHGVFHVGAGSELYLFIYDVKGNAIANGYETDLVGKNRLEVKDAKGKFQVREFIKVAKTKGSGWVDYSFSNPLTKKIEPKATYVEGHENFVFCCGIYKN